MRKFSSMFIRIPGRILKKDKHRIQKNKSNRYNIIISKVLWLKYSMLLLTKVFLEVLSI